VYAYCEARGMADGKLALYPSGGGETSPRQEFLKALMFSASSPDSLLAPEVELAERVIAELAPSFLLANAPAAGLLYWTGLARAIASSRAWRSRTVLPACSRRWPTPAPRSISTSAPPRAGWWRTSAPAASAPSCPK